MAIQPPFSSYAVIFLMCWLHQSVDPNSPSWLDKWENPWALPRSPHGQRHSNLAQQHRSLKHSPGNMRRLERQLDSFENKGVDWNLTREWAWDFIGGRKWVGPSHWRLWGKKNICLLFLASRVKQSGICCVVSVTYPHLVSVLVSLATQYDKMATL